MFTISSILRESSLRIPSSPELKSAILSRFCSHRQTWLCRALGGSENHDNAGVQLSEKGLALGDDGRELPSHYKDDCQVPGNLQLDDVNTVFTAFMLPQIFGKAKALSMSLDLKEVRNDYELCMSLREQHRSLRRMTGCLRLFTRLERVDFVRVRCDRLHVPDILR